MSHYNLQANVEGTAYLNLVPSGLAGKGCSVISNILA